MKGDKGRQTKVFKQTCSFVAFCVKAGTQIQDKNVLAMTFHAGTSA